MDFKIIIIWQQQVVILVSLISQQDKQTKPQGLSPRLPYCAIKRRSLGTGCKVPGCLHFIVQLALQVLMGNPFICVTDKPFPDRVMQPLHCPIVKCSILGLEVPPLSIASGWLNLGLQNIGKLTYSTKIY